jgi:CRP/FNR family transcriptional regulator, cyclic AMP receptor protein
MVQEKESNFDKPLLYKKGQVIFAEGENSSYLYLINYGEITVVKDDGQRLIPISQVKDKEFLGEQSIFVDEVRSTTAIATKDSEVYIIKKSEVKHVMKNCPEWVGNIMATLCERLNHSNEVLREHRIMSESLQKFSDLNPQEIVKIKKAIDDYRSRRGLK